MSISQIFLLLNRLKFVNFRKILPVEPPQSCQEQNHEKQIVSMCCSLAAFRMYIEFVTP